jgi:hypothetical protein
MVNTLVCVVLFDQFHIRIPIIVGVFGGSLSIETPASHEQFYYI